MAMSLDGFITGPGDDKGNPAGVSGRPRAGLELRQLGQHALGSWPIAVLAAAFGVEVESAARTASEGFAQLVTGPEGNSALDLVQERG